MKLQSQADILEAASLIMANTQKEVEIQKRMALFGFPQKRMQEGEVLLKTAQMQQQTQTDHYDEKWTISRQLASDIEVLCATFKDHVKVVRVALRQEPATLYLLKINRIASKRWACIQQALYFYDRLEEYAASVQGYGISLDMIQQSQAAAAALLELKADRMRKKGLAEDSTQEKNKAFQALRTWVIDFRRSARLAFKDNPQMLEVFGMKVRSSAKA